MDIQKRLEEIVENAKSKFNPPSVSAAITVKGRDYYYSAGFSDVESQIEASPGSIYAIASSSKAFIATCLCMLSEEGKLDLDSPVKKYLPDFAMYDPYMTENMTIRDALSHRTGMPRHDLTWLNSEDGTIYDTVKMLRHLPPAFPPRYRMHYQNHMFTLATVLVEKVSGMDWQKFIKSRIFDPLEMTSTYATGDMIDDANPLKARPYSETDGVTKRIPYLYISGLGCCGAIYSTAEDLLKWSKFNLYGDEKLLKESLNELHTPQMVIKPGDFSPTDLSPEVDLTAYGLGWFIESYRGHKMVHHGGTINGFKSIVGILPGNDIGFAVLSNLNGNQTPMSVAYAVADMALGLEPVDWPSKIGAEMEKQHKAQLLMFNRATEIAKQRKTTNDNLTDYIGHYAHSAYGRLNFSLENEQLTLNLLGRSVTVQCIGEDEFIPVAEQLPEYVQMFTPFNFERNNEGKISSVNLCLEEKINSPIHFERVD